MNCSKPANLGAVSAKGLNENVTRTSLISTRSKRNPASDGNVGNNVRNLLRCVVGTPSRPHSTKIVSRSLPKSHFPTVVHTLLFLAVAAFCVGGFLATFEPTDNALTFRVGYTVIGLGCLVGVGLLLMNAVRK